MCSPREIRKGEEIAWYADGDTIVRNEHNPTIAYAYGIVLKWIIAYLFGTVLCTNWNRLFVMKKRTWMKPKGKFYV